MSSLQVLTPSIDRRLVTPTRLAEIVSGNAKATSVESLIGKTAVEPQATVERRRFIDMAGEKIERLLEDRRLYRQQYRFRTKGTDRKLLGLDQWPAEREGLVVAGDVFDYTLNEDDIYLYRRDDWRSTANRVRLTGDPLAGTESDSYRIDHTSGYLMSGQTDDWTVDRAYIPNSSSSVGATPPAFGSWVKPSDPTTNELYFECVTAGTTDSAEPTWPTAATWFPETTYAVGDWVLPPSAPIHLWYEVTTPGTSAGVEGGEPEWTTTPDETVADNDVVYTARQQLLFPEGPDTLVWAGHFVEELPLTLQHFAALLAIELAKKVVGQECDDDEPAKMFVQKLQLLAAA